jgi:uncharacterized protein involved in outer membrane biogenesis
MIFLVSVLAVVLLAVAILVSVLANPDSYRSQLVSILETRTGKQIEIGRITVHWLSSSIELYGFGVRNPTPFPNGYIIKAPEVDAIIKIAPLLRREIVIKSIVLHEPVINVISDPDGLWNFQNPTSTAASKQASNGALGTIPKLEIVRGQLFGSSLIDPSDRPGPVVFEVHDLSASLANLNLDAFSAQRSSPVATGNLNARSLRLGSIEVTGIRGKLRLQTKQIVFESLSVDADHGHAAGELEFNLAGKNAEFKANARLSDIDVAELLANFPEGRGKMTGTMRGDIALAGPIAHTLNPLAGLKAIGDLTVVDGELPGLNSNNSLKKMTRFRNPIDAGRNIAAFSSFSSDLELTKERMTNRNIDVAFYGVDLSCAGHLDLNATARLEYRGTVKVLKKQGFLTNLFAEVFREGRNENGKLVFPLRITGMLSNPKFALVD